MTRQMQYFASTHSSLCPPLFRSLLMVTQKGTLVFFICVVVLFPFAIFAVQDQCVVCIHFVMFGGCRDAFVS